MTKSSYQLVNPVIQGSFQDVYDAQNPLGAAKNMWTGLSEHIVAHVPKFPFTLRNISNNKYHHFEVSENGIDNSFTIKSLNLKNVNDEYFNEFATKIDNYNNKDSQKGGRRKRYDDSSSSSSSSTDYPVIKRTSPISIFHYTPSIYYRNTGPYKTTLNPQAVLVQTPIFTPIFRPVLGSFVAIWP